MAWGRLWRAMPRAVLRALLEALALVVLVRLLGTAREAGRPTGSHGRLWTLLGSAPKPLRCMPRRRAGAPPPPPPPGGPGLAGRGGKRPSWEDSLAALGLMSAGGAGAGGSQGGAKRGEALALGGSVRLPTMSPPPSVELPGL